MMAGRNIDVPGGSGSGTVPRRPKVTAPTPSGRAPTTAGSAFRVTPPPRVAPVYNPTYDTMMYRAQGLLMNELAKGMPLAPIGPSGGAPRMPSPTGGGGPSGGRMRYGAGGGGGGAGGGMSKADINEAIKAMQDAADVAKTNIAGYYSTADQALADMAAQYAASEAATRQGAGRTLGAFGVSSGALDPMAMSAGDYLTSQRGTLAGMSADQQARLEAQKAAYALILGDLLKGL